MVKLETWKALLVEEGATLEPDEWANATDLVKAGVGKTELFRLAGLPASWHREAGGPKWRSTEPNTPDYLLVARFVAGSEGRGVFLRLVDPYSGALIEEAEATAADLRGAIDSALSELEAEAAMMPWRCRVTGARGRTMVIDRGHLDGLRKGTIFVGYALAAEAKESVSLADEQAILLSGTRTGEYRLVEEGRAFSKVEPVGEAPPLASGDILEIPEIRLKDRSRSSRRTRLWDKLYGK